jgi:ribonucleoside-diphosphate reductase alpha chain
MYAHTKVTVMCICAASFGSSKKERAKLTNSIYKPEGLAKTIFQDRYTITPEESWEEASLRLARHSASVEEPHNRGQVQESFNEIIATNKFMPGGRIWYGSERPRAQLLNCFVVPTHDSREGWGKTISDVIVVSGMGGGVGINMSPIRPRGSRINGTGGYATGAVSLMEMIDGVGNIIMDGGGRRMALMLDLNITHPDMPEFLDKKLDRDKLQNANISIVLDKRVGTKALIDKVQNNKNIDLVFGGTHYDSINAKELWGKIVNNAWKSGEPGILNGDLANRESNIFYALVLPRFINEFGTVDWDDLAKTVHTAVRFLDNVLSVNEYPLPEIRENCNTVRRIGLGIMGLHSMLIELGYKYSSDSAKAFVDELMGFIKNEAYKASIALAIEKGPFPAYDEQMLQSGFMKRAISSEIKSQIKKHGIRNCALLTIAPTGTTGMVSNVSTGIEPLFSAAYWRRFYRPSTEAKRVRDKELVVDPLWTKLEQEGKDISVLEGAYDITPEGHFEMQVIAQNHIDNAVSKTINLPENYPVESLGDVWLEYLPKVKGATLYRAGSRGEEPLEAIPLDEARELMRLKHEHSDSSITEQNSMDCPDGVCEIPEELKPHITEQVIQFVG